jgi:uncharacterized membrane protein
MPTLATILATLLAFAVGGVCLFYAIREGMRGVAILLCGAVFGLIVEYFNMRMFHSYHYGPFPFMLFGTVPLMIVVSWGAIIYAVMRTSDHMKLRWFLRPFFDGFLALTIDLSLDPVSIILGYWVWDPAFDKPYWFNVPLGNYYGWYMVVFWFSLVTRLGFRYVPHGWFGRWRDLLVPALSIVVSLVPFYLSLSVYGILLKYQYEPMFFSIIMGANLLAVLRFFMEVPHDAPIDYASLSIPLFFHPFVLVMLYGANVYREMPALIILVPLVAVLSVICFAWPSLDRFRAAMKPRGRFSVLESEQPTGAPAGRSGQLL